jgi:hypothetical protein
MKTLNTHLWNLGTSSLTAAAIGLTAAACGPAVEIEGDTDGGSETESDTLIDPTTDTDIDPMECLENVDCPDGFVCLDGECYAEPPPPDDCEDYDYGCYCYYGHCSPPYYYDCYDDEECNTGELCQGGYCDPVQSLPACGDNAVALEVPLPIPTDAPVVSLAFVDLDPEAPGEALLVGTAEETLLLESGVEPRTLPELPATGRDAVAADLDGDDATDLVVAHDLGLSIIYSFGGEEQQVVDVPTRNPISAVERFVPIDADQGIVVRTDGFEAFFVDGLSERTPSLRLLDGVVASGLAPFDDGLGTLGFVLELASGDPARLYFGDDAFVEVGAYPRMGGGRDLVTGTIGGAPGADAVWATPYFNDWTYIEFALDAEQYEARALYFNYPRLAAGDLDGDGLDDLLSIGTGGFAVMPGDAKWGATCFAQAPLLSGAIDPDIGDYDGDGVDELATTTDDGQLAVYDVSWSP